MPALFSFLGGMASGYNAKKAAEADLAAKKEIKAQEAAARMDVANIDNTARRESMIATSQIDAREKEIFRLIDQGVLPSDPIIKEYQRQILEIKGGGSVSGIIQEAVVQETNPVSGKTSRVDLNRQVRKSEPVTKRKRKVVEVP